MEVIRCGVEGVGPPRLIVPSWQPAPLSTQTLAGPPLMDPAGLILRRPGLALVATWKRHERDGPGCESIPLMRRRRRSPRHDPRVEDGVAEVLAGELELPFHDGALLGPEEHPVGGGAGLAPAVHGAGAVGVPVILQQLGNCLLYTSPSPRD